MSKKKEIEPITYLVTKTTSRGRCSEYEMQAMCVYELINKLTIKYKCRRNKRNISFTQMQQALNNKGIYFKEEVVHDTS